jgi:hypothetical protein
MAAVPAYRRIAQQVRQFFQAIIPPRGTGFNRGGRLGLQLADMLEE